MSKICRGIKNKKKKLVREKSFLKKKRNPQKLMRGVYSGLSLRCGTSKEIPSVVRKKKTVRTSVKYSNLINLGLRKSSPSLSRFEKKNSDQTLADFYPIEMKNDLKGGCFGDSHVGMHATGIEINPPALKKTEKTFNVTLSRGSLGKLTPKITGFRRIDKIKWMKGKNQKWYYGNTKDVETMTDLSGFLLEDFIPPFNGVKINWEKNHLKKCPKKTNLRSARKRIKNLINDDPLKNCLKSKKMCSSSSSSNSDDGERNDNNNNNNSKALTCLYRNESWIFDEDSDYEESEDYTNPLRQSLVIVQ